MPFLVHYGDKTDSTNLIRLVQQIRPTEIHNLAAQSHVAVSLRVRNTFANADAVGVLRLLESIRILGMQKETRFYQASTSEFWGLVQEIPQKETTTFYPRSPYGVAKLYGDWITVNYREPRLQVGKIVSENESLPQHFLVDCCAPSIIRVGKAA